MKIKEPTYSQIPNVILDSLDQFSEVELCVLFCVCRATFGWHRPSERLTLDDFMRSTGRSRPGIVSGIASLCERGLLEKLPDPRGNTYRIRVDSEDGGSSTSELPVVKPVNSSSSTSELPPVKPVNCPNKERKDLKKAQAKKPASQDGTGFSKLFTGGYVLEYENAFGEKYRFQGGKDGAAIKRLESYGVDVPTCLERVRQAFTRRGYPFDNCVTISGFVAVWNNLTAILARPAAPPPRRFEPPRAQHHNNDDVPLPTGCL